MTSLIAKPIKLRLFVAIDRTSKFAFVELHQEAGKMIAAVPYAIHTVLTDNGRQPRGAAEIKELPGLLRVAAPMTETNLNSIRYPLLARPHVYLSGTVDHDMYASFSEQLAEAPRDGTLVVAICTLGGDPEVARLMGDEIRLIREFENREILFLGKVAVYSAGATFMSHFPIDKRFLTRGTRIMIHERKLTCDVHLEGPLKTLTPTLKAKLHEIEESIRIEEEGFRDLVDGSTITFEEVRQRAPFNWYIEADDARDLGLVLDVI